MIEGRNAIARTRKKRSKGRWNSSINWKEVVISLLLYGPRKVGKHEKERR